MTEQPERRSARRRAIARRKARNRRIAVTVCLMLAVCLASVGGTLAWLTDKTETITNTFTTSDIKVTLTETKGLVNGKWEHQVIPGYEYEKDPVVAVDGEDTNVDVYLFVKFTSGDTSSLLDYTNNLTAKGSGWTALTGEEGVYYRVVKTTDTTKSWKLIGDNKVTVKTTVTKEQAKNASFTMTYQAFAHQLYKSNNTEFNAPEAWANVKPTTTATVTE